MKLEEMIGKKVYAVNASCKEIVYEGTVMDIFYKDLDNSRIAGVYFKETYNPKIQNIHNLEFMLKDYNIEGFENNYNKNKVFFRKKEALDYIETLKS